MPSPTPPVAQLTHSTAAADRVSLREKTGLGFGRVAAEGSLGALHVLVNPVYNMTLGLNPVALSTVVFIQRLWDSILDPLAGQFSDNFRSRWGRRLPLLVGSVLPLAVLFVALWWLSPGLSPNGLFWHLLIVSLAFYVAHSFYAMALGGLVLEATDDYHERTRLMSFTFIFGFAFNIAGQWLFPLTQMIAFSGGMNGLRVVTLCCAAIFLVCGLLPVFLCRERNYTRVAARLPRVSLWKSLKQARENRPFVLVLSARFVASFGYNIVGMLFLYMNIYYVFGGDLKAAAFAQGILGSSFHVASIVAALLVFPPLARKWGKKRVLQMGAAVLMLGSLSKLVIYQAGHPWWQFVVLISNGVGSSGIFLMINSMLGDIADYDEWRTGLRREALFVSLVNWCDKAGNSLGSLLCGLLLVAVGFNAKLGVQSSHTLQLMKFSYVVFPFLGALAAILITQRYDLDEAKSYEIKRDLADRRAAGALQEARVEGT